MSLREMLEEKLGRFEQLEKQLLDPAVQSNSSQMAAVAREHGSMAKLATKYRRFKQLNQEVAEAAEMAAGKDAEMRDLADAELPTLRASREQLWNELLDMTVGGEDANRLRCVMEIRAGTGGDEAALFARDLYEMYRHHAEQRGWKVEVLDMNATELGGFKEVILGIEGEDAYRELQYESGGHRVQRVPETEQTRAASTLPPPRSPCWPSPRTSKSISSPTIFAKTRFCASGPGGQHVNKTASAIRLTHYETNIVVSCQDEKSQHKNFAKALRVLKTRLYEHQRKLEHEKRATQRKTLVGSGDRSERIRTYNFPDNRVTDHRINLTLYKLDAILAGNVQPLTDALLDYDRQQQRQAMGTLD